MIVTRKPVHMPGIDEETERYLIAHTRPISKREYEALKGVLACACCLSRVNDALKDRLRSCVPYGYREARMLEARFRKLFDKILLTIPREKLKVIQSEMQYLNLYIRTDGAANYDPDEDDNVWLPRKALQALADIAGQRECELCDKKGKEVTRCKLRKILAATFPHAVPTFGSNEGECLFNCYEPLGHEGWGALSEKWEDDV